MSNSHPRIAEVNVIDMGNGSEDMTVIWSGGRSFRPTWSVTQDLVRNHKNVPELLISKTAMRHGSVLYTSHVRVPYVLEPTPALEALIDKHKNAPLMYKGYILKRSIDLSAVIEALNASVYEHIPSGMGLIPNQVILVTPRLFDFGVLIEIDADIIICEGNDSQLSVQVRGDTGNISDPNGERSAQRRKEFGYTD